MNTTPEQRAEWAKLDKEATPERWQVLTLPDGETFVAAKPYEGHPYFGVTRTIDILSGEDYPTKKRDVELVAAYRSAVPSLLADVAELLEKFAGEEKVSDELGEMAGKYQRDWETAQAQVERLTALLRETLEYVRLNKVLRYRIKKELEEKPDVSGSPTMTVDKDCGAIYLYVRGPIPDGGVNHTVQASTAVNLDYDFEGNLIGVEVLP